MSAFMNYCGKNKLTNIETANKVFNPLVPAEENQLGKLGKSQTLRIPRDQGDQHFKIPVCLVVYKFKDRSPLFRAKPVKHLRLCHYCTKK